MRATINLFILIATIAAILSGVKITYAAQNTIEVHNVVVVDFNNGSFIGALQHLDGDSYRAISFSALDGNTQEDMFKAYGDNLSLTIEKDDRGSIVKVYAYSAEYDKVIDLVMADYTDNAHIVGYCTPENGYTACTLDGDQIQAHGFIVNGEITKLRGANAYSVTGTGWLLQNGNLISYAIENGESRVYTTYLAVTLH